MISASNILILVVLLACFFAAEAQWGYGMPYGGGYGMGGYGMGGYGYGRRMWGRPYGGYGMGGYGGYGWGK